MINEERIKKSEEIRNRMNENFKKHHNVDYDMFPFFVGKPSHYFDMEEITGGDFLALVKVQCDGPTPGLDQLMKYKEMKEIKND
ncbi:MAG: hypothetical protein ACOC56_06500 [Atribacterota bacterium]